MTLDLQYALKCHRFDLPAINADRPPMNKRGHARILFVP